MPHRAMRFHRLRNNRRDNARERAFRFIFPSLFLHCPPSIEPCDKIKAIPRHRSRRNGVATSAAKRLLLVMKSSSSLFPLVIFYLRDASAPLSLSLGRQKRPVLSISDATKRRVCNSPLSKERLSIKSIDRSDRCTVGRHARPPCARPQSLLYRRRKRTRRMHTREAAEQAATAEKHWENAKVKPISILSILAGMRFASGLSPSSRNGFFPFFSIEFRPIERIGSNRIESGGEEGENGRDGMGRSVIRNVIV